MAELIFAYTRAEAIADGVLVDVSDTARQAGIPFSVAMTRAAWSRCVDLPPQQVWGTEQARLLTALRFFKRRLMSTEESTEFPFEVLVISEVDPSQLTAVELKAVCGLGDEGEPVVTLMLPRED